MRRRVTRALLFLQRAIDDVLQCFGRVGGERRRFGLENRGDQIAGRLAGERPLRRDQLIKQNAEAENICAGVNVFAARLFGREIIQRTENEARLRLDHLLRRGFGVYLHRRSLEYFGESEIEYLHQTVGTHHHVLRLDVAVDDACFVRGGERTGHLCDQVERDTNRQCAWHQAFAQSLAFDVFGDEVIDALSLTDFMNRDDVRMIERRSSARFLLETQDAVAVGAEFRRQQFDSNLALQSRIVRQPNFAHAACAQTGK